MHQGSWGVSNSNCSEGETRTLKRKQGRIMATLGPHYEADVTKAYLSLTRNSFYIFLWRMVL